MNTSRRRSRLRWWLLIPLGLLAVLLLTVLSLLVVYRPDRPAPTIAPGSATEPKFAVQIIRPRAGLPLGGLLPPELFGLDAYLGFDSTSPGAQVVAVHRDRVELVANGWELLLVLSDTQVVSPDTYVEFELVYQEQTRRVRCRPGDPVVATVELTTLDESGELAGSFNIELPHCEDAESGKPLGWPPQPFVLHGSFDRLTPQ